MAKLQLYVQKSNYPVVGYPSLGRHQTLEVATEYLFGAQNRKKAKATANSRSGAEDSRSLGALLEEVAGQWNHLCDLVLSINVRD
ncbi:uncharacterized protein LOC112889310 [Panicum hallii]|uniref:uncharacterized protein LOC112889310 n=1 Tax=Panicum hallii TaxID=206008 RepID=UPI000DF4CB60|nr:uncharacterized protein LOC112889310 [Panicum hallii]